MNTLKDKHKGEEVYLIGKGVSLEYLRRDHIGQGIIIALNQAIIKIEELRLPNITYSMQKDGFSSNYRNICVCRNRGKYGEDCEMILPQKSILLVHELESSECFKDYIPRYTFNNEKMGLAWNNPSIMSAIKVSQLLGCVKINLVSFDSITHNNCDNFVPNKGRGHDAAYIFSKPLALELLKRIPHSFITPS